MDNLVIINNNQIEINEGVVEKIINFNKIKLEMDLFEKELKNELKEAMEKTGTKKIIINDFFATYKDSYKRKGIDSQKLQKEMPEIYEKYSKETTVASSIIISVN